jgi:tetratricopeptide (TPR) repeat protein
MKRSLKRPTGFDWHRLCSAVNKTLSGEIFMKNRLYILVVFFLVFAGCASIRGGSDFQTGRRELLYGDPEVALAAFQQVAKNYPDRLHFSVFPEGSWTYVGRAAYASKRFPEAEQALRRAVSLHREDDMAKLYLGLTHAQMGARQDALPEIESGMRGIYDWLEYVERTQQFSYGRFWDPRREIRSGINDSLRLVSGREFSWPTLIRDSEWVGRRVEEEIELARRDEQREFNREGGDDRSPR